MRENKMNHKDKLKLARKLRTPAELKARVSIFQTKAWEERKIARTKRKNDQPT